MNESERALWFDAHLDLASFALAGRDMTLSLAAAPPDPKQPAVTLPSLQAGGVTWAFATIFTGRDLPGPLGYPSGDGEAARRIGVKQLEVYEGWEAQGMLRIVRSATDLEDHAPLKVVLLMEGADPILDSVDAAWWYERGVRVVGLSWWRGTRYAGGNGNPGPLTDDGRELLASMDDLGIIHDLSHLADAGVDELLASVRGPVVATHSNSRALMDGVNQRHLTDSQIKAVSDLGGIVGLNLAGKFLTTEPRPPSIDETVAHVEHAAKVMGHRGSLGLGSDMDGGFGPEEMPVGIDEPSDLWKLTEALSLNGWSDSEVRGFSSENWLAFLRRTI